MKSFDRSKLKQIVKEDELQNGPAITVFGGGTGLSTLLRGLKKYTDNLVAVVAVSDNGGSSGMIREDLHILPPGDIRNCIMALANTEPLMFDLLNYRFPSDQGRLSGQSFGNLFIAAMAGVSGSFYDAIRNISKVLAVKGKVVPVSLQDIQISALLADNTIIRGESEIGSRKPSNEADIYKMIMEPDDARPLPEVISDINQADILVLGPGSLYTSIIPHLLFPQIRDAIKKSSAVKIYIGNIMTQPAETLDYDLQKHISALVSHSMADDPTQIMHYCIANNQMLDAAVADEYTKTRSKLVEYSRGEIEKTGVKVIEAPLVFINERGAVRHNHNLLAEIIMNIWYNQE
ncbi:MAG: gluconeogenesis factor YvcK family protein [Saccharofermentanales bacterium]